MRSLNLDLYLIVALAAAGVVAQFSFVPLPLHVVGGVLLVLICPAYALVSALFPGRSLGLAERVLFGVGLSLAVAILGAVILNAFPQGLDMRLWAALFLGVTLLASMVAFLRRNQICSQPQAKPIAWLRFDQVILLGAAIFMAGTAFVLVRAPRPVTGVSGYTTLWMLPNDDLSKQAKLTVGVSSSELEITRYRLSVLSNGREVENWDEISLAPGENWEANLDLTVSNGSVIQANLYRLDDPETVYRQVTFDR